MYYTFNQIKGNQQIIKSLKSSIINNRISHAYIIDGKKGIGKKLIANIFAKTLQCEKKEAEPCNKCKSCKTFDSNNNPDIIYVKATKTKSIGIDDIREQITKNIETKPYENTYKIFIIENSDNMTIQAQNAILKTLEEPPKYSIFILLSENYNKFIPTIISRCILFKLKPLDYNIVKEYIVENIGLNENEAYTFSLYSQGNIGRAKEIINSEEFKEMREMVLNILSDLYKKDLIDIYTAINEIEQYKDKIYEILDIIYITIRDAIIIKTTENYNKYIMQKDKIEIINLFSQRYSLSNLIKKSEIIYNTKKMLIQNSNFQITMEVMFFKLKEK